MNASPCSTPGTDAYGNLVTVRSTRMRWQGLSPLIFFLQGGHASSLDEGGLHGPCEGERSGEGLKNLRNTQRINKKLAALK